MFADAMSGNHVAREVPGAAWVALRYQDAPGYASAISAISAWSVTSAKRRAGGQSACQSAVSGTVSMSHA